MNTEDPEEETASPDSAVAYRILKFTTLESLTAVLINAYDAQSCSAGCGTPDRNWMEGSRQRVFATSCLRRARVPILASPDLAMAGGGDVEELWLIGG